jgi:iron(III) transport system ATP-binding protein
MGGEFRALQRRLGITTLYVTHDQEEAMALSDRVVVMQKGRVLQVGAPEEVYRRPAGREVATFFGTPNLVSATVRSCRVDGNGYALEIESAHGQAACRAGEAFHPGDAVLVIARPEDIVLVAGEENGRNGSLRWRGKVVDSSFRGSRRVITVDSAGNPITAECSASHTADVGHDVALVLDAIDAWAVRRSQL